MLQQRRVKSNMTEMEQLKEQARKERKMKAAAQAANLTYKYSDDLKFNLQPQQTGDGTRHLSNTLMRALGDYRSFSQVLKVKESHLFLGLDDTVPGTPEVNDVDFENPLNGYLNEILAKPGKNGLNNHVPQLKKVVENVKNISSNEFAVPKGKVSKHVAKQKPPKLEVRKSCTNDLIKNPNNIESILKEMTQPLPPALTDIETPSGKGNSKMFQFPQESVQLMPINDMEEKPTVNGGTCKEEESLKLESFPDAVNKNRSSKKADLGKKRVPPVKSGDSRGKTKPVRKLSTSSGSSSDDSSSDGSASSDSESEKVGKQEKTSNLKKTSAINSPLNQDFSPSKMHKTKSPFNNNNYILNKENNVHTGLFNRSYAADINLKQQSMNDLNGFPYSSAQTHMNLNNVVQDVTEDTSLIGNHTSLFPSPMDIGKTISPLDQEIFDVDEFLRPELNFLGLGGEDLLIPSKNDNDFDKVTADNPSNSRVNKSSHTNLDFTEPSLDDSFESNNLILNKLPIKYKKDSKDNTKKPSTVTDERNKSSSKSNETKDKSKSKSTRMDSGPSVKVNSGSKGQNRVRTKAELKSMPGQRRKSTSESSDKDDNKSRKSKESSKKSSSEKDTKKEKKDRLKSKVNRDLKDVISLDSPTDKKHSNIKSSTPSKLVDNASNTNADTLASLKSPLTNSVSSIDKNIVPIAPPISSPNSYTVKDLKVEDKCDIDLYSKNETGNIFETITKSIGDRVSPWISPECYTHVENLMDDGTYDEPLTRVSDEIKLVDEVKEEINSTGYESPLKFAPGMLSAVELKPSPVHNFSSVNETVEEGNASVNDMTFGSQPISSVDGINFTQTNSSVIDISTSVNDIPFSHNDSSINNLNFYPQTSSVNTLHDSHVDSSINNFNFSQGSTATNNSFSLQAPDLNFSTHPNDVINFSSTLDDLDNKPPRILLDELHNETTTILDHSLHVKPVSTELLIDDNPYSVKDIEIPVSVPGSLPISLPVSIIEPSLGAIDPLNSEDKLINRNCFDPITSFNDTNLSKLTIKIPLHAIKLRNKYKSRHNTCNDIQIKSTVFDSSLSSGIDEDQEIDVENEESPIKRKRKMNIKNVERCDTENSYIKDVQRKLDCEFDTPNKEQYEKLIISISLAKLKRAPLKGVKFNELASKDVRSPKVRPPKICKLDTEPPADVTTDFLMEDGLTREEQSVPSINSQTPSSLASSTSPSLRVEDMETENCHQNDVSQPNLVSTSEKDTTKKRGRPRREKVNTKADTKADTKSESKPIKTETNDTKNCDSSEEDVCRECGTLRKDYGRDSHRISSYNKNYNNYFNEGSRRKHEADNSKPSEKPHKYIEAVLKYVQYLIGLELSGRMKVMQGIDEYCQITSDSIHLVDYVISKYGRKENPTSQYYDVRFTLLCLRLQSILYLKLFKVKKESAMKYSKVLSKYFKQFKAAGHTGPTPYTKPVHNRGSTGTPSPSSPSPGPSPGGSVASIGSAGSSGSTGSNDITANGGGQFVTIPTDVHEKAFQHLQYSKNLLHGHFLWEDSELLVNQCQPFVTKLSKKAGQLTITSSMLHVVDYVTAGLDIIKELPAS